MTLAGSSTRTLEEPKRTSKLRFLLSGVSIFAFVAAGVRERIYKDIAKGRSHILLPKMGTNIFAVCHRCPPCWLITAAIVTYTLQLKQCSDMYLTDSKKMGSGNDYANGVSRITVINADTTNDAMVSDGSNTFRILASSYVEFVCYSQSSPANTLIYPWTSISTIPNSVSINGNLQVGGTVSVMGTSTLNGDVSVGGGYGNTGITLVSSTGDICMDNNLEVAGTASVTGSSSFNGDVAIGGGFGNAGISLTGNGFISMDANLHVGGSASVAQTSTLTGNLQIGSGYVANTGTGITVDASSGSISVNGFVQGNTGLFSTVNVNGGYTGTAGGGSTISGADVYADGDGFYIGGVYAGYKTTPSPAAGAAITGTNAVFNTNVVIGRDNADTLQVKGNLELVAGDNPPTNNPLVTTVSCHSSSQVCAPVR